MPFNLAVLEKLFSNDGSKTPKKSKRNNRKRNNNNTNIEKAPINTVKKVTKQKPAKDMDASIFRFINEKLSSLTSKEAFEFFQNDPEAFETYHKGFGNQRDKWPEDPVHWIISRIKSLEKRKSLIVADMGCGDGNLGRLLSTVVKTVHSYDLVATTENVVSCDISNLPLSDDSVDVAVISLALMGVNSNEYIAEANRVLKNGGSLIIIELVSRMKSPNFFIGKIKKMGFEKLSTNIDKEKVKENAYFMKLHMRKIGPCDRDDLPDLELKPVLYKKR